MPRLKSSRDIIKTLEAHGFEYISQRGSHLKYFHTLKRLTVIVPANKREIPMGTLSSIARQAGLSKENF